MRFYVSVDSPRQVASSPRRWLAIPGVACIAAAIIGGSLQLGDITLPPVVSAPRQAAVGALGAVLILVSFVSVARAGRSGQAGVLAEPEFWLRVFDVMPPAFIKQYPTDDHLADNQALRTFQGRKPAPPPDPTELHTLINADHRHGDSIAATTGASVQLEYTDQCPTKYPQLILTRKARVEFDSRTFIVGWYVPIESPGALADKDPAEVKNRGEQVLFQISPVDPHSENPFLIDIGKAVRRPGLHPAGSGWRRRRT